MMPTITMSGLLEAGAHFGHQARYWNPKMAPYIYGKRFGIHIINLEHSLELLRKALNMIYHLGLNRGRVLFVGTKHAARDAVREEATRAHMPYVNYRWLGGMLTNYKTIRQSIKRLKELEESCARPDFLSNMTKKEATRTLSARDKLHNTLSGMKSMGGLPDLVFVIDVNAEHIAVQEAKRLGIPVMGIVDTNSNPQDIDYVIPGNDDAARAIRFYCQAIADTLLMARSEKELMKREEPSETHQKTEPRRRVVQRVHKSKKRSETEESSSSESASEDAK